MRVADVLTENFRPGTLERWGLGYERLSEVNPGLVLARISGYGQTGPYAERAGFASVAEAMGGLRHINGFPGEAPPRTGVSLGDSLAAMFAVQGILAALYHRDVLGDGRGQVVDVSLMESSFAMLESTVPEYDRLGIVREPAGTNLAGIAPSNIFKSRDDLWMVIAANNDNLFRRLCDAMEPAELADDPRFATHAARGENQEEIEGIVAAWAHERDAAEIDRVLNEAGVVCGPIYTVAEIFRDPQYAAREMLVEHVDPEFGPYVGPGIVPKFSETPGAVRWSGTWEHGQPQRGGLQRAARALRRGARPAARGWRRMTPVTICDVGPRDGLQNQPVTLEPGGARRARRPARRDRHTADRGGQLRQPEARPADGRRRGGRRRARAVATASSSRGSRSTSAATTACATRASTRCISPSRRPTSSTAGTPGATVEEGIAAAERIVERASADGIRSTVTIGVAFGCPFEGAVDPGRVAELAARFAAAGTDEIVVADTVGVGVPRQARDLVERLLPLGRPVGVHLHNTRNNGFANAIRRPRGGRDGLRRLRRRDRRLPVRSPGDGQHRDRGPRLPLPRRRRRDGHRSRGADRRRAVARITARARARGPGLQGRDVHTRGRG